MPLSSGRAGQLIEPILLNFGTSAFLKLVCCNERPQRTTIRQRVKSSGDGGYDFHRSLRLRVKRLLVRNEAIASVAASIDEIVRSSERESARAGIESLEKWRSMHPGKISGFSPVTYESPAGLFKVAFTPDFGIEIDRQDVAVHVWNTKTTELLERQTYGVLSLFKPLYEGTNAPNDVAVLSLRDSALYRLSEAGKFADMGDALAVRIEDLIRDVRDELGLPDANEHPPEPRP